MFTSIQRGFGFLGQAIARRDGLDIVSLGAASTAVKLLENALRGGGGRGNAGRGLAAGIIDTVWTTATTSCCRLWSSRT